MTFSSFKMHSQTVLTVQTGCDWMWFISTVCFNCLLKCWWGNLHTAWRLLCWPSTQLGQVCQFVTMMNDMMVTLLHLSLTSNNICLNSPMQATNPSTPIKHFNTMLPAGKYEKRGTNFHTGQIACRGLHYKFMAILTNLTKLGKSWNFIGWKVLHPLPHSK